jgi:hypothetical protein
MFDRFFVLTADRRRRAARIDQSTTPFLTYLMCLKLRLFSLLMTSFRSPLADCRVLERRSA